MSDAESGRPRPLLAAALALLYPGLGHVYLRRWGRAMLWFLLAIGTAIVAFPQGAFEEATVIDPRTIVAAGEAAVAEASTFGLVTLVVVLTTSIVDAYAVGYRQATVRDGATCPNCRRSLDEDLAFCHWCTTRLDGRDEASNGQ